MIIKVKILDQEANYEANLEFFGGRGVKQKTFHGGRVYRYFLELHILLKMSLMTSSYLISC